MLWQKQYDNENNKLSMLSIYQKFTENFPNLPTWIIKKNHFVMMWFLELYENWYTYYSQQLKYEMSLMMDCQLEKLIP